MKSELPVELVAQFPAAFLFFAEGAEVVVADFELVVAEVLKSGAAPFLQEEAY